MSKGGKRQNKKRLRGGHLAKKKSTQESPTIVELRKKGNQKRLQSITTAAVQNCVRAEDRVRGKRKNNTSAARKSVLPAKETT